MDQPQDQQSSKKLTQDQVRAHYAESKSRMVGKLLSLSYSLEWHKPESPAEERMERSRVNANHLNRWLLSEKSAVKKTFSKMTHAELTKAITQLEEIYKHYTRRV